MRILIELERYTKESLIIQTRNPDEDVLVQFLSGNLNQFIREELKSREQFNYPPFFTLIKITYKGPQANLGKAQVYLENMFKDYNISVFRGFTPKIKNLYVLNIVLKIKRNDWTLIEANPLGHLDPKLLARLQALPPALSIQIDPEDLI